MKAKKKYKDRCIHSMLYANECMRGFGKCNGRRNYNAPCGMTSYESKDDIINMLKKESEEN